MGLNDEWTNVSSKSNTRHFLPWFSLDAGGNNPLNDGERCRHRHRRRRRHRHNVHGGRW